MDKLSLETKNLADEKFKKLVELFPNALTETIVGQDEDGNSIIERAIDADILRQEIAEEVVEGRKERYEFNWPDKRKSMLLANAPINKTLRPIREDSLNFDETENLYIEGDNLDALKLLRETYLGKIKMIYIDPPYNTGSNFIYEDDFAKTMEDFKDISGDFDETSNRLFKNLDSNGRFHTDWLNMIYPRLKLARDLLSDKGVMFVSIDEHELLNLIKIIEEIYGRNSYDVLVWRKNAKQGNTKKINRFKTTHEYIIAVYKNKMITRIGKMKLLPNWKGKKSNVDDDPRGNWESGVISRSEEKSNKKSENYYSIILPSGRKMTREFYVDKETFEEYHSDNRIYYPRDGDGVPRLKIFENEEQEYFFDTIIDEMGTFTEARNEIDEIFGSKNIYDTPKPTKMLKELIRSASFADSIVLDFFSGSATTAHAVMELNAEDGGNRKHIMVQLPEKTEENSEAFKTGYKNICDIGKERIRRAGKKIKEENPDSDFDAGFRVLRIDASNMKDVYHRPEQYDQNFLSELESNIKEDRTEEDLLFQVMLNLGIDLSSSIDLEIINGNKVFTVAESFLLASFDSEISEATIEEIAKRNPYYAVFSQGKMSDSTLANFEQIFATYSPSTRRKVI